MIRVLTKCLWACCIGSRRRCSFRVRRGVTRIRPHRESRSAGTGETGSWTTPAELSTLCPWKTRETNAEYSRGSEIGVRDETRVGSLAMVAITPRVDLLGEKRKKVEQDGWYRPGGRGGNWAVYRLIIATSESVTRAYVAEYGKRKSTR